MKANQRIRHFFVLLALTLPTATIIAQGSGSGASSNKDSNPANPANWELISSVSGNVSYVSYPFPNTTPTSGSFSLAAPPNPMIYGIAGWGPHYGTWNLSGKSNFRWNWIGLGPAPIKVRIQNGAYSAGLFSGFYTFTNTLTDIDNVIDLLEGNTEGKYGGEYRSVDTGSLFHIGYNQSATVHAPMIGASGQFSWGATSLLKELSTALRYAGGANYRKVGDGPHKEINVGDSYSSWVMDTAAQGPNHLGKFGLYVDLTNALSGPWSSNATFTYDAPGSINLDLSGYQDTIGAKKVRYEYTREQWEALATAPDEKTVTVKIKDTSFPDAPERTATIKIRVHNPDENWRLLRHADNSPYESFFWKGPSEYDYKDGKSTTYNGDEKGVEFKYRHEFPIMTMISQSITGKEPLLNVVLNYTPSNFKMLATAAQITVGTIAAAENWQGPMLATFGVKWGDPNSTFEPVKDESRKNEYLMTASVNLKYKYNVWKADGYDSSGYNGPNPGETTLRVPGQYVYGIFKIGNVGGGGTGGGITPGGSGG